MVSIARKNFFHDRIWLIVTIAGITFGKLISRPQIFQISAQISDLY